MGNFKENAAYRPHVDSRRVYLLTKDNFRCSIPKSNYLVCVGLKWEPKGACEPEIGDFDIEVIIYQNIAWLQVPVHNSSLMAVQNPFKKLL